MKYFTKEELDIIADSLIKNPSYETLKELNFEFENKYGKKESAAPVEQVISTPISSVENMKVQKPLNTAIENQEMPKAAPLPMGNDNPVNTFTAPEVPSFSIPAVETPIPNSNINNNPINFSGNLWEPEQDKLMSTTDNFNNLSNNSQSLNTSKINEQFFTMPQENVPNPIPVNELNMQNNQAIPSGPSMFGQFEQNYNK